MASVPLLFLIGFFAYGVRASARTVIALTESKAMLGQLGRATAGLQQAVSRERAQAVVYYAHPTSTGLAALESLQTATDHSLSEFDSAAHAPAVRRGASPAETHAIAALAAAAARLPSLRARIPDRAVNADQVFAAYTGIIADGYTVLEQAVIGVGSASQALPAIAVIQLGKSDEYLQQESALVNGAFAAGSFSPASYGSFAHLVQEHRLLYAQSVSYLSPASRADVARDVTPRVAAALASMEDALVGRGYQPGPLPAAPSTWNSTVGAFHAQVQRVLAQAERRLEASAAAQAGAKLRWLLLTGGIGLAAVIVSVIVSLWIARTLTRQLAGLRQSALELANEQLPGVVRRLRAGEDVEVDSEVPPLTAMPDEIGQVKAAFNAARRTAVEAAVDEARLRRGISDVIRNLARRSQSLLQRQIALLDALERRASDPDNLEGLFRIDHLTTRMRRHAENLMVLIGDSSKRSWRNPVPFVDVLRAAASEVEDYTRIRVFVSGQAALAGSAVADVIHLLAELAENATVYSPRDTEVRIIGEQVGNGFAVEIVDRGLGLAAEDLNALNACLADPPDFDLSGSDQLGIFVTAQLAKRHGIGVSLTTSPYGGLTAVVLVPQALVVTADEAGRADLRPLSPADRRRLGWGRRAAAAEGASSGEAQRNGDGAGSGPAQHAEPASAAGAPADPGADADGPAAADGAAAVGGAAADGGAADGGAAVGAAADGDVTENGLPRRVRQASLAPQLTGSAPAHEDDAVFRDPETARAVMSALRRGRAEGLDHADVAENAAVGAASEGGENQ